MQDQDGDEEGDEQNYDLHGTGRNGRDIEYGMGAMNGQGNEDDDEDADDDEEGEADYDEMSNGGKHMGSMPEEQGEEEMEDEREHKEQLLLR